MTENEKFNILLRLSFVDSIVLDLTDEELFFDDEDERLNTRDVKTILAEFDSFTKEELEDDIDSIKDSLQFVDSVKSNKDMLENISKNKQSEFYKLILELIEKFDTKFENQ